MGVSMQRKLLFVAVLFLAQSVFANDVVEVCETANGSVKLSITTGPLELSQEDAPSIPVDGKKEVYSLKYNDYEVTYGIIEISKDFDGYDMDFDHYAKKIIRPNEIEIFLAETNELLLKLRLIPMSETEKLTLTRILVLNGGQIYEGHKVFNYGKKVSIDVPAVVLKCKMQDIGPEN